MNKIRFLSECFHFLVEKFSVYLNRLVFVILTIMLSVNCEQLKMQLIVVSLARPVTS